MGYGNDNSRGLWRRESMEMWWSEKRDVRMSRIFCCSFGEMFIFTFSRTKYAIGLLSMVELGCVAGL